MIKVLSSNIISPLGFTSADTFEAVRSGRSALRKYSDMEGVPESITAALLDRDAVYKAAQDEGISGYSFFDTLALLSCSRAIKLADIDPKDDRTAFFLSSIKGNVDLIGTGADVSLAASAANIASFFGCASPVTVVSNACISGLCALIHAQRALLSGLCDRAVVVGAECQSPFIINGFLSLKALSPEECRPFDAERIGLNLGEAAACIVLSRAEEGSKGWALCEGAIRNDANHISGPSRTGEGSYNCLVEAMKQADSEEIAFINAHGTATAYNDEMESIAIDRAGLSTVPVNALKGYFGHTMGAAGVLESILSMYALDNGIILGTRGFSSSGVSRSLNLSAEKRPTDKKAFLKLLSGFGGCNAALLFRKNN